ncbi:hypothetical protein OH77DRAFT_1273284 [Trametes cingulata]|nr:hypothetical protein OH77DRAFT_1273284 [Trametes cingulata]
MPSRLLRLHAKSTTAWAPLDMTRKTHSGYGAGRSDKVTDARPPRHLRSEPGTRNRMSRSHRPGSSVGGSQGEMTPVEHADRHLRNSTKSRSLIAQQYAAGGALDSQTTDSHRGRYDALWRASLKRRWN